MVNSNHQISNHPAIDLSDLNSRICVQVTAQDDSGKIKETIKKFIAMELYEKYDRLIFLMIAGKKAYTTNFDTQDLFEFDKNLDIWDLDDLLSDVENLQLPLAKEIASFVNDELQPIVKALAPTESLLAGLEVKASVPPKTAKAFINFVYENGADPFDTDAKGKELKFISRLYSKLSKLSKKSREYLAVYLLRGQIFNQYESKRVGLYWKDLHNILPMTDVEATQYFKILEDINLVSHDDDGEHRAVKLYLHYALECDLDFFVYLKKFCKSDSLIKKVLVDCDFSLLD